MLKLCLNFNLYQFFFYQPTRGSYILDLLLKNFPDNVRNALYLPGLSDLKLFNLTHSLRAEANEPVIKTIIGYSKANFEAINQEL